MLWLGVARGGSLFSDLFLQWLGVSRASMTSLFPCGHHRLSRCLKKYFEMIPPNGGRVSYAAPKQIAYVTRFCHGGTESVVRAMETRSVKTGGNPLPRSLDPCCLERSHTRVYQYSVSRAVPLITITTPISNSGRD